MGKTTVSSYLQDVHALPILDADIIARNVVALGSPVQQKIVDRYGENLLLPDGELDRVRLGEIVFNSPPEKHWLERQIHPYVREHIKNRLNSSSLLSEPVVILVVPLLFEARMTDLATEIWVVYCKPEQQIERLLQRETHVAGRPYRLNREQVKARIQSQMPIEKKLHRADFVIDNSSTLEHLHHQIDRALAQPPQRITSHV